MDAFLGASAVTRLCFAVEDIPVTRHVGGRWRMESVPGEVRGEIEAEVEVTKKGKVEVPSTERGNIYNRLQSIRER